MLESLALLPGAVNQKPPLPATSVGFFSNTQCGATAGACNAAALALGCFTVETVVPIFDNGNPSAASTGGRIVRACYFDHPRLTWDNLARDGLTASPSSANNNAWIVTGCARVCMTDDACNQLTASEGSNGPTPTPFTPQRCVVAAARLLRLRSYSMTFVSRLTLVCCSIHLFLSRSDPFFQLLQRFLHLDHAHLSPRLHPGHAFLFRMVPHDPVRRLLNARIKNHQPHRIIPN